MCGENGLIEAEHLGLTTPPDSNLARSGSGELLTLASAEKRHIFTVLDSCKGNRTNAAKILDLSVRTLRNKLADFNDTAVKPETEAEAETAGK